MVTSPQNKTIFPTFVMAVFISVFILFGIMEFRHTKAVINRYEAGIMQLAVNRTEDFQENLKTVAISIAKKVEKQQDIKELKSQVGFVDSRLTDLYIVKADGTILDTTSASKQDQFISRLAKQAARLENNQVMFSGVHLDDAARLEVITLLVPLSGQDAFLAANFRLDQYKNEINQLFASKNYRIAVFDSAGNPLVWPFEGSGAEAWDAGQDIFYYDKVKYNVVTAEQRDNSWKVYFFFEPNNFELYRAITVMLLVFALYICLYELLVEFWGVNEAKTYFENIDFAIFNQIHEGVIIANNSGRIIFANEAAHQIFADRKSTLRNIRLKEVLGNNYDLPGDMEGTTTITINSRNKLFKAIHSPIIKNNKILGSLTVLRSDSKEADIFRQVLDKLMDVLPQGIIFVNRDHEVALANLMARCYLSNVSPGSSIEVVDRELADFIYKEIDARTTKRVELVTGLVCEVTPVYDDDGIYAGTLVVIPGEITAPLPKNI